MTGRGHHTQNRTRARLRVIAALAAMLKDDFQREVLPKTAPESFSCFLVEAAAAE
jgi:hypothetical protein